MEIGFVLAVIGFVVGLGITPIVVIAIVKGLRSLNDVRDLMGRPPGDYGRVEGRRDKFLTSD